MENLSAKEEDMLMYNTNYPRNQQEAIDDKDSSSKSCDENNDALQNGRWNPEEHHRFILGCLLYGNNWKKVKKHVKTRSSAQIRSHAQKYLIKLNKKYDRHHNKGEDFKGNKLLTIDNETIEYYSKNYHLITGMCPLFILMLDNEQIERIILYRFSTGNDKTFNNIAFDDSNLISEISSVKKESRKKEKIFNLVKVSKAQRMEEVQQLNQMRMLQNNNGGNEEDINGSYGNLNVVNQYSRESLSELENFIHSALNSYDTNELLKLLTYFDMNNDQQRHAVVNGYGMPSAAALPMNMNGVNGMMGMIDPALGLVNGLNGHMNNHSDNTTYAGYNINDPSAYYYAMTRNTNDVPSQEMTNLHNNNNGNNNQDETKNIISSNGTNQEAGQYRIGLFNEEALKQKINGNNSQGIPTITQQQHQQYLYNLQSYQNANLHPSTNTTQSAFTTHPSNNQLFDNIYAQMILQQNQTQNTSQNHSLFPNFNH